MIEWKWILGLEGKYQAGTDGSIKSYIRYPQGKIIVGFKLSPKGYKRVNINGNIKFVHSIIGKTFIENPDNKPQINHKDGNKLNNNINNLEWVTNQENRDHAVLNNLIAKRENGLGKLTVQEVSEISELYFLGFSQQWIAKAYGVSQQTISRVGSWYKKSVA